MGDSTVFDRLLLSAQAAETVHAVLSEDLDCIRISPQNLVECHILIDFYHC